MLTTMKIEVTYLDGRVQTASVLPVTQVAFERNFKCSFVEAFDGTPQLEHVYFLAWHAARTGLEFDDWLPSVAGISDEGTEPVDPTSPAASAGE